MKEDSPNETVASIIDQYEDINALISEQRIKKEEATALAKEGKYKEAEEIYQASIDNIKKFQPNSLTKEISFEENRSKLLEVLQLTKELYSNLSLIQGKQFHYGDALTNALYIIQYIDEYHDKSYIRIINWLIAVHQLDKANEVANEVRLKFKGEELRQFDAVFNVLKLKNQQFEEKKTKNEGQEIQKYLLFGGLSVVFLAVLWFVSKKFRKNNNII